MGADKKHHTAKMVEKAKAVCAGCTVLPECLWSALLAGPQRGVLGGLSEDERKDLSAEYPDPVAAMFVHLTRLEQDHGR